MQEKLTSIGFGSNDTTTPASSVILCFHNRKLEQVQQKKNLSRANCNIVTLTCRRAYMFTSRMYRATHNSSPAEIPTAGPTWNSHYNYIQRALKTTSYRTKVYKSIYKGETKQNEGNLSLYTWPGMTSPLIPLMLIPA